MTNRDFATIKFYNTSRNPRKIPNTCTLVDDNWDDFTFKTSFSLIFVDEFKEPHLIGRMKIARKGLSGGRVQLPDVPFDRLPDDYCSLGWGQGYYEELMVLSKPIRELILEGLRDCVQNQDIIQDFQNEESFYQSLLREVSEEQIRDFFPTILAGNAIPTAYRFEFQINGESTTKLEFDVTPRSMPPTNVHVLIGRNGVGKTRMLAGIAQNLSQSDELNPLAQQGNILFPESKFGSSPFRKNYYSKFTNLITVVFSAFDNFIPITKVGAEEGKIPCHYVGLKTEDGESFISPNELKSDFEASLKICFRGQRKIRWIEAIQILNSDPIFKEYNLSDNSLDEIVQIYNELSSGHKIVLLTVTKLVELVDDKTLVLLDEPETHLHPPLLSSFMKSISDLMIKRNAVAIIATHSPVVLQEVPKSCVTIVNRFNTKYTVYRPSIETYGETISRLTREIFQLEVLDSGFYKTISDYLKQNPSYDNLVDEFDEQLGSEAKILARSILLESGENGDV